MLASPDPIWRRGLAFMSRYMGLRQRIMAILIMMAAGAAGIVALCLHQQSVLLHQNEMNIEIERQHDAITEAAIVLLQAANTFSSLGLSMSEDESRAAIAKGDKELFYFELQQATIRPYLNAVLSADKQKAFAHAAGEIRRSWNEIVGGFGKIEYEEIAFRLLSVTKNADIARRLLIDADATARATVRSARAALTLRAEKAKRIVLAFLIAGIALLLTCGWVLLNAAVKRPLGVAIAAVARLASGDFASPVPKATTFG